MLLCWRGMCCGCCWFTDAFCDFCLLGLWCYDVVGVIVNSVVDARGVFGMFVMVLACLDFDLVFIQLVDV